MCTRVSVCIEIESAKHFEYDNIHIRYHVFTSNRWKIINDDERSGSTHSSQRSRTTGLWFIGYCHELNILCHHDYRFDGNCMLSLSVFAHFILLILTAFLDQLKIIYDVTSIDSWERERNEGCAIARIPLMAGHFREKIRCYRDLGNDPWIDWFQRYFVGGRQKVRFNEFNGIGGEEDCNRANNRLNRYGNKTETTGYLNVVRNVIVQRHVDTMAKPSLINKTRRNREAKIHNLLTTYQDARERLELAAQTFDN